MSLHLILDNIPAELTGAMGLAMGMASILSRSRGRLIALQAICTALFVAHYGFLGAGTAMSMSSLGLLQMMAALRPERSRWTDGMFTLTCVAAVILAASTWAGPMSALSLTNFLLGSLGRWQTSALALRSFYVGSCMASTGHDLLAGSLFGFACDVLALSGHGWALCRDHKAVLFSFLTRMRRGWRV